MALNRGEVSMTPTLDRDSGWKGEASGIRVQLGTKAEHIFGEFDLVIMPTQLVYQVLNCSADTGHRTVQRASINPNSDHKKLPRSQDIKPSVGPEA
jgi:hypothetical protein